MLTKKLYRQIRKHWWGRIYSDEWIFPRLKLLRRFLHYLDGKDVFEVGANAGVFAYEIVEHARSYVGIEKEQWYFEQAVETSKYMDHPDVLLLHTDLLGLPENLGFDAFVGLFVLYHFYPPEVDVFEDRILPQCDTVLIQLRDSKRPTIKNDRAFEKPENTIRLLKHHGFRIKEKYWQPKKRQFITIVGKR